ncbi:MAG: ribose-5-phosphate isomerase RpiA [Gammaproteobacteria bacterium]
MSNSTKKAVAARAALDYIEADTIIGVGTGSTVNCFIEALADIGGSIKGAVSSSEASTQLLNKIGVPVVDLNDIDSFDVYVDGADESNSALELIKGGGGALTREKIVAQAARRFVCIVDDSKLVDTLGAFPLPVEVIPMARSKVAAHIEQHGGEAIYREGFVTDNGNHILDVHGLSITAPCELECEFNQIPGVVTVGLFAQRPADVLIIGSDSGVRTLSR